MVSNTKTRHRAVSKISVSASLHDSDDESEDGTNCLDLAKFPVPAGLSEEKGGGEPGGGEGSQ